MKQTLLLLDIFIEKSHKYCYYLTTIKDWIKLNIKNKFWILLLPIFLISTITCNSLQDSEHSHSHHDSIIHIHQHNHSTNIHSHYHTSSSITILDYLYSLSINDNTSKLNKQDNNFELKQFYSHEVINKLLKPPKLS